MKYFLDMKAVFCIWQTNDHCVRALKQLVSTVEIIQYVERPPVTLEDNCQLDTTKRKQRAVSLPFWICFIFFQLYRVLLSFPLCLTLWDNGVGIGTVFFFFCLPLSLIILLQAHILFLTLSSSSQLWNLRRPFVLFYSTLLSFSVLIIPLPASLLFYPLPQWISGSWSRR